MRSRTVTTMAVVALMACPVLATVTSAEQATDATEKFEWVKDYGKALEKAKADEKLVMIDFATHWCGWCKVLDKMTWPDVDVQKAAKHYVMTKLDGDKEGELLKKYGIRGFPGMVIVDREGRQLHKISGYVAPDQMAFAMNAVAADKDVGLAKAKLLDGTPEGFHELVVAGDVALEAERFERAIALLEKATANVPEGKRAGYESAVQNLAIAYIQTGHKDKAVRLLEDTLDDEEIMHPPLLQRILAYANR